MGKGLVRRNIHFKIENDEKHFNKYCLGLGLFSAQI